MQTLQKQNSIWKKKTYIYIALEQNVIVHSLNDRNPLWITHETVVFH